MNGMEGKVQKIDMTVNISNFLKMLNKLRSSHQFITYNMIYSWIISVSFFSSSLGPFSKIGSPKPRKVRPILLIFGYSVKRPVVDTHALRPFYPQ